MSNEYITTRNDKYRVRGTRVSLDSIVYAWREGLSPESIAEDFPALALDQIYGAIAFYLAHQADIDEYLRQQSSEYEALRQKNIEELRTNRPQLYQKLITHKQRKERTTTPPELAAK